MTIEKDELNENLTKIKGELSENYEKLKIVDADKATIQTALRSLDKDITEIDEKLRKDEGRKLKIQ